MFFYLLSNSTLIKEEDENTKNTKILVYGAIAYIVLHATLFIGGEDCLFSGLKPYYWMLLLLDIAVLYLVYLQTNKGSIDTRSITSVFRSKEREDSKPYLLDISESAAKEALPQLQHTNPLKKNKKKKRKNVNFDLQAQAMGQPSPLGPTGSNSLDNGYSSNLNGGFNPNPPPTQSSDLQRQRQNQSNMLNLNIMPSSDSDSDSDITTDVDLNEFERSISM
jgi:hypothetical protein